VPAVVDQTSTTAFHSKTLLPFAACFAHPTDHEEGLETIHIEAAGGRRGGGSGGTEAAVAADTKSNCLRTSTTCCFGSVALTK
jgi:hypothetical protein